MAKLHLAGERSPSEQGEHSEAHVLAALVRAGFRVLLPFGGSARYDLVIDMGRGFRSIQVKTGRLREGAIRFNGCSNTGNKRQGYTDIDMFGVYCPDNDQIYLVPTKDVGDTEVSLRVDPPANGQTSKIRWAKEYVLGL